MEGQGGVLSQSDQRINLLPRCDTCGVEYTEDYEGPCQEPRGTYNEFVGWSSRCSGKVSWRATAEKLHALYVARLRSRDLQVEMFRNRNANKCSCDQGIPGVLPSRTSESCPLHGEAAHA